MKKIFLPLLALCGMVTGLTLTSCGGGGGDGSKIGREYEFTRSFGAMRVAIDGTYKNEGNTAGESFSGTVSFKEGEDDYTTPDTCDVTITPEPDGRLRVDISAVNPGALAENAVLAFMGQRLVDENAEGDLSSLDFYMVVDALPEQLNGYIQGGEIHVEQLIVVPEADEEIQDAVDDALQGEEDDPEPGALKGVKRIR